MVKIEYDLEIINLRRDGVAGSCRSQSVMKTKILVKDHGIMTVPFFRERSQPWDQGFLDR
jgi:hypothetical protein